MKAALYLAFSMFILLGLAAAYWFGKFAATFDSNTCYSETLSDISKKLENVAELESWSEVKNLSKELTLLPLHGYESNCEEIKLKVKSL